MFGDTTVSEAIKVAPTAYNVSFEARIQASRHLVTFYHRLYR